MKISAYLLNVKQLPKGVRQEEVTLKGLILYIYQVCGGGHINIHAYDMALKIFW